MALLAKVNIAYRATIHCLSALLEDLCMVLEWSPLQQLHVDVHPQVIVGDSHWQGVVNLVYSFRLV